MFGHFVNRFGHFVNWQDTFPAPCAAAVHESDLIAGQFTFGFNLGSAMETSKTYRSFQLQASNVCARG